MKGSWDPTAVILSSILHRKENFQSSKKWTSIFSRISFICLLIISCLLTMYLEPIHPQLPVSTLLIYPQTLFSSFTPLIFFFVTLSPVIAVCWHVDRAHWLELVQVTIMQYATHVQKLAFCSTPFHILVTTFFLPFFCDAPLALEVKSWYRCPI